VSEHPATEAVDPDPFGDDEGTTLGGRAEPDPHGDPTAGGKLGEIGDAPSIVADEPADGSSYPVGGGRVDTTESQSPPDAAPGADR
jgi:hypothetical protein